jgi:GNAT superfamily N-acetyltransferase
VEPPNLDQLAKKHRRNRYIRIRSAADCAKGLASNIGVVQASFDIVGDDWSNAPDGCIPFPEEGVTPEAAHTVAVVIVDEENQIFAFPNTWGVEWGNRGWGYMPYEYFDEFVTDAWFLDAMKDPAPPLQSGITFLDWMYHDVFGRTNIVIEVNDWDRDERIGWCFVVEIGTVFEVEEFFVMPAYRRKGYGTGLMRTLLKAGEIFNRSILFWISHPDWNDNQRPVTQAFLQKFGFAISGRDVRWASAKATLGMAPPMRPSGRPIPPPLAPMGMMWHPK